MIMQIEREQNTYGKGVRVKIPLLPNNVGKKSVNNVGPKQGHNKVKMLTKIKKQDLDQ